MVMMGNDGTNDDNDDGNDGTNDGNDGDDGTNDGIVSILQSFYVAKLKLRRKKILVFLTRVNHLYVSINLIVLISLMVTRSMDGCRCSDEIVMIMSNHDVVVCR